MKCTVEGCNKPSRARGMCKMHYTRDVRHGDASIERKRSVTSDKNDQALELILARETDRCITWPFYRNADGYGKAMIDGVMDYIHRRVCERAHGPAPDGKPFATHSCGNGHLGCCNKRHLQWGSGADNSVDRRRHGTETTVLTEDDVRSIKTLIAAGARQRHLAAKYGVSASAINSIAKGRTWAWVA